MIQHIPYINIFSMHNVEAIVNPVNIMGIMGAGLAKQYSEVYPDMVPIYQHRCHTGKLVIGKIHVYSIPHSTNVCPKFVVNVPTKDRFYNDSTTFIIKSSLLALIKWMQLVQLTSIAIPPLGCGCGNMQWKDVLECYDILHTVQNTYIYLIYPKGVDL